MTDGSLRNFMLFSYFAARTRLLFLADKLVQLSWQRAWLLLFLSIISQLQLVADFLSQIPG
jgi:hypothetical protein